MSDPGLPTSPVRTAETDPFWDAANQGRLVLKQCTVTCKAFHPPRSISPFTDLSETTWVEASGRGTV